MTEIDLILKKYTFVQRDNLIPILQEIQETLGFLSTNSIAKVGEYLNMPTSKIYGLATFYNQFRFEIKAKHHIRICNGTSCHLHTNSQIIREFKKHLNIENGEMTKDGLFSLEETTCMGACGLGPVVAVNNEYYTKVTSEKVCKIIEYYSNK